MNIFNIMCNPYFLQSGDLAAGVRNNTDIHFGLYYSLYEWFNPLFLKDKASGFTTTDYRDVSTSLFSNHMVLHMLALKPAM